MSSRNDDRHLGERIADDVANFLGSWRFIVIQSTLLALWILLNITLIAPHWDGYPFIFLNLMLSFQAAYTGPLVLLSQNRQAQKDRERTENDYQTNLKSEREVRMVMKHLNDQDEKITLILEMLQTRPTPRRVKVPPSSRGESV